MAENINAEVMENEAQVNPEVGAEEATGGSLIGKIFGGIVVGTCIIGGAKLVYDVGCKAVTGVKGLIENGKAKRAAKKAQPKDIEGEATDVTNA